MHCVKHRKPLHYGHCVYAGQGGSSGEQDAYDFGEMSCVDKQYAVPKFVCFVTMRSNAFYNAMETSVMVTTNRVHVCALCILGKVKTPARVSRGHFCTRYGAVSWKPLVWWLEQVNLC